SSVRNRDVDLRVRRGKIICWGTRNRNYGVRFRDRRPTPRRSPNRRHSNIQVSVSSRSVLLWRQGTASGVGGPFDPLAEPKQRPVSPQDFHDVEEAGAGRTTGQGNANRLGQLPHLHPLFLNQLLEGTFPLLF